MVCRECFHFGWGFNREPYVLPVFFFYVFILGIEWQFKEESGSAVFIVHGTDRSFVPFYQCFGERESYPASRLVVVTLIVAGKEFIGIEIAQTDSLVGYAYPDFIIQ